jgi:hypothetical protein
MLKAGALFIFDLGYTNVVYRAVNAQLFSIVKRKRERNNKPPPLDIWPLVDSGKPYPALQGPCPWGLN